MNAQELLDYLLKLQQDGLELNNLPIVIQYEEFFGGTIDEVAYSEPRELYPSKLSLNDNELLLID